MKLIIDCMGGDRAPLEMLKGVCEARAEFGEEYLLCGDRPKLEALAAGEHLDLSGFEFLHTESVIRMEDHPMSVLKEKADSSMALGLKALADGRGDAFVSCGNTGALFTGGSLLVHRMQGIHRAAIGTVLPFQPPVLLLDAGANVTVQPDYLLQFAVMGSAYMKSLYGLSSPRVGLLNNGTEEGKGTPLQIETRRLLSDCPLIHFVGNVEANTAPFDVCDVLVTDGFTGNIMLKSIEGIGNLLMGRMKGMFMASPVTKLSALTVKKHLRRFKKDFDPAEHGGSPILGLSKPVIKAHGSSNARAFKNAVRQAIRYTSSGALEDIEKSLAPHPAHETRKE